MAENAEKTAAVIVGKLANEKAEGKTATVVSGKLAIGTRFNVETYLLDKSNIFQKRLNVWMMACVAMMWLMADMTR